MVFIRKAVSSFSTTKFLWNGYPSSRTFARFVKSRYSRSADSDKSGNKEEPTSSISGEDEIEGPGRRFSGRDQPPPRGVRDMEKYSPRQSDLGVDHEHEYNLRLNSMNPDKRRSAVHKFIQQAKSSYGAPVEGGKIGGDPFLTTPYVRGARRMGFDQGNDAVEESLRRKIDPATTSVSGYYLLLYRVGHFNYSCLTMLCYS